MAIRRVGLALVSTITPIAHAQDFTLSVEVPVVSVDVSVTNAHGQPVVGLGPDDFKLFEDGRPQEIRQFGASTAPYHLYLMFDRSGSTRHKWDFMRAAAQRLMDSVKLQDRVSIGVFDGQLRTLAGWDATRAVTLEAMGPRETASPSGGGTTEFYRSLVEALEHSFDGIRERRAIVVLTDGRDTSLYTETLRHNRVMRADEDRRFRKLYQTSADAGIPVYIIALNTDLNLESDPTGADEHRNLQILYGEAGLGGQYLEEVRVRMERIARVSGGQIMFPGRVEEVIPLFEEIGQALGSAYSLTYIPVIDTPDTRLRRIEVIAEVPNATLRQSREGYYPISPR